MVNSGSKGLTFKVLNYFYMNPKSNVMGRLYMEIVYYFIAGVNFKRQNQLDSKVDPRTKRVDTNHIGCMLSRKVKYLSTIYAVYFV